MLVEGLLPIGSVVLLKESNKRIMITGLCQRGADGQAWDYSAVHYPEGFLSPENQFLFNHDQIERLYAIGYQNEEQKAFKEKAEQIMKKVREQA